MPLENIFLIVLDSVRRDYFSERLVNRLDELKSDFVNFENCFSIYTSTFLSHYTIFYGDYISSSETESFPFQLKKLGYNVKSYCNGAVILGYPLKMNPNRKNTPLRSEIIENWGIETPYEWQRELFGNRLNDYYGAADDEDNKVPKKWVNFLNENNSKRNYLFLHFWKTHHNYGINDFLTDDIVGKNYLELAKKLIKKIIDKDLTVKTVKKVYYKKIEEVMDKYIQVLLQILKINGIYDDSLIIITSDHGEGLGDIGKYYNKKLFFLYDNFIRIYDFFRRRYRKLPDLKRKLNCMWERHTFFHNGDYKLQREIPLLVKFPKNQYGGVKYSERVTLFDIIHTLNDLLDNTIDVRNSNGTSLYALLAGDKSAREKHRIKMNIKKLFSQENSKNI